MTDINIATSQSQIVNSLAEPARPIDHQHLLPIVELIFIAYRDFTGESDAVLKAYGFGRAHHRALHFVTWRSGLRVADLLEILKITKQSLARVLKQLVDRGFIIQEAGAVDRRERRLYATRDGRNLADQLIQLQTQRIASALREIEPSERTAAMHFLLALSGPADRIDLEQRLAECGSLRLATHPKPHER